MLDLLSGFISELRQNGLPVSLTEHLDAAEAVHFVPLEDRDALKYALAATLIKSSSHWRAFETAFDVYFANRMNTEGGADENGEAAGEEAEGDPLRADGAGGSGGELMTPEEIATLLYRALMAGDTSLMRLVARQAVSRYAGIEPGRPVGGTYYLYRTPRKLDLDAVLQRILADVRPEPGPDRQELTPLQERLLGDEYRLRIEQLRKEGEEEIRRRLVADRGAEALARSG